MCHTSRTPHGFAACRAAESRKHWSFGMAKHRPFPIAGGGLGEEFPIDIYLNNFLCRICMRGFCLFSPQAECEAETYPINMTTPTLAMSSWRICHVLVTSFFCSSVNGGLSTVGLTSSTALPCTSMLQPSVFAPPLQAFDFLRLVLSCDETFPILPKSTTLPRSLSKQISGENDFRQIRFALKVNKLFFALFPQKNKCSSTLSSYPCVHGIYMIADCLRILRPRKYRI